MVQVKKHVMSTALLLRLFYVATVVLLSSCYKGDTLDADQDPGTPFNPAEEIFVEKFMPTNGRKGTRILVYGRNFGNDPSKVKVTIGGQPSKVISVKGESLLCLCPSKAYDGDVKVAVVGEDDTEVKSGVCEAKFEYRFNYVVTTFLGTTYENNTKWDVLAGPFDNCGAFENMRWLKFDPNSDFDDLYWSGTRTAFRHVDFKKEYVDIMITNLDEVDCVDFTPDGDMILTDNHASDTKTGIYLFTRESGFTERISLCAARGLRNAVMHPTNRKIYFTPYHHGQIETYNLDTGEVLVEATLPHTRTEFKTVWHPLGKYAYVIFNGKHCIYRVDLNQETNMLESPYLMCGQETSSGYQDGMGSGAKLAGPEQGIFVKNPEYAGQKEEYDFYFCDKDNHCIRILTPEGRVTTYAGRGGGLISGYVDGELRTQALFYKPAGIAYDEKRNCFYVGDMNNHRIRKIAPEE